MTPSKGEKGGGQGSASKSSLRSESIAYDIMTKDGQSKRGIDDRRMDREI